MNTIVLKGIAWDTENLEINRKTHFMYGKALHFAENSGKRLPTKEEFEELLKLPHEWDDDKHGMWFVEREEDLKTVKSLFLPAAGNHSNGTMYNVGKYGYYWAQTPAHATYACCLYFYSTNFYTDGNLRSSGCAVRLVK